MNYDNQSESPLVIFAWPVRKSVSRCFSWRGCLLTKTTHRIYMSVKRSGTLDYLFMADLTIDIDLS